MPTTVEVPVLDHDAMMLRRFGTTVSANGKLERRIVANLIAHMERHGWHVQSVFDGDEDTKATDAKSAMELLFDLDEAALFFGKDGKAHNVTLIFGNGIDLLSDWNYSEGDADGFNAACEAFDAEVFA